MKFLTSNYKRKFVLSLIIFALFLFSAQIFSKVVYSDEYDDLTKKIADLQTALSESQKATKPLQSQLT